ncbi:hypothetical protein [Bacillus cereus]|uniref:hypothetical protein n=1 Tax=Bacillus cereus TaxID=1396 RepID=UPI00115581B5|nr:hypothetical protein [Bacillus cereus]
MDFFRIWETAWPVRLLRFNSIRFDRDNETRKTFHRRFKQRNKQTIQSNEMNYDCNSIQQTKYNSIRSTFI